MAFLDSWYTDPGRGSGSSMAIQGLGDALHSLGHTVERIAPKRGTAGSLRTRLVFNAGLRWRLDPGAFDAIVGFDLDGCFLPPSPSGSLRVASLKGVAADEARFESGVPRVRLRLLAALEARAARKADRVIVTSRYCLERAAEAYGLPRSRFDVVPEGIDLEGWHDALRQSAAGASEGRRAAPTVLTVARQYPRKDTRSLLEALPAVLASMPDARLRIVGGGPELPALKRRAAELSVETSVTFLGEVGRRDDVVREYARADVFCLPSRQEGFGIVFLEAMATGLPIVACRAAAVPEVVPDGEVGLLVPPSDPPTLARALVQVLGSPELGRRLGDAGRKRARRYDWSRVAERFMTVVKAGSPDTRDVA
jgi:glycosyltransferase involved in cell wall biosynthesis